MTFAPDARPLIQAAYDGGYALPAFNFCSLEMAKVCIQAAADLQRPILVQTYPADVEQASPKVFAELVRALAVEVSVPVALHLDHGRDWAQIAACLRAGYSSVMFDGQGLEFVETLRLTRELAVMTHASGASLEVSAESFGVPGAPDHMLETTDPTHAAELRQAGTAMVACAVGSKHGRESRLKLGLLRDIAAKVGGPLVLHGGSGIHKDDLQAALKLGVVKVNVGSALYRTCLQTWRDSAGEKSHRTVYASVRANVREAAKYIRLMAGSSWR